MGAVEGIGVVYSPAEQLKGQKPLQLYPRKSALRSGDTRIIEQSWLSL